MARKPVTKPAANPADLSQTNETELPKIPEGENGNEGQIDPEADAVETVEPEDDLVPMLSVAQSGVRPGTIVHIREMFIEDMVNKGEITFLPEEE
jgi:hypothetical protein